MKGITTQPIKSRSAFFVGSSRRRRIARSFPAKIKTRFGVRSAFCVNWSEGGLGLIVESLDIPRPQERLEVNVDASRYGRLSASGTVVHVGRTRPDKIGLRFDLPLSAQALRILAQVLTAPAVS